MSITVKYFASLNERLGRAEDIIPFAPDLTVTRVWSQVTHGQPLPANVLTAVNLEYAAPDTSVHDGDEVAFFPPITGGR